MLGKRERSGFIEKHIRNVEEDNRKMLEKIKERINKVEVKLPTVEVRYKNLTVDVRCKVVGGDPLPSLWNTTKAVFSGLTRLCGLNDEEREISIIRDASGIIKPSRMTLLLGPPGCGKTTLLLALSGKLGQSMKVEGDITYNGVKLEEFCPGKTSAYISQNDLHIPQMTVRETLDFSGRCQGIGSREDILMEVQSRENSLNAPEQYIDTYMKETSVKGLPKSLQTDYVMKILGMDSCSEIMVGDAMQRGISGGQRRRLTTGEMIVGPSRVLFMDEISNGLDSSTTFQIVSCLQQSVHISEVTALVSLLQPAPETFELFDDVILMSEGIVIYHGPRDLVLDFFEDCGFKCPDRKAIADFLQEVISKKDQAQYWFYTNKPHAYVTADQFSRKFKESLNGNELEEELLKPYDKSNSHQKALAYNCYSLSKWELFKTCLAREYLLMKRDAFVYIFKTIQLGVIATITMTVFLRTQMKADLIHSNYYMGSIFYTIIRLANNGIAELAMTVSRLPVFYRQRDFSFYPAWAYSVPAFVLKIPISFIESFLWTMLTYYVIGYSPEPERLFRQFLLLFALHLMSTSLFRFLAAIFQTPPAAACAGNLALVISCLFCGFIIPRTSLPFWLEWGFWISPFTYAEIGIALNEFEAPRWKKVLSGNMTTGQEALQNHGINFRGYMYWVSVAALTGFAVFFNIGFTLALSYQQSPGKSQSIISREKLPSKKDGKKKITQKQLSRKSKITPIEVAKNTGTMVLPFTPLAIAFQDVKYFIDTPKEMREESITKAKLQLLSDITGAFRPGILSALMGVSGAGKTTLMDVLSGRKTGGYVEGEIKIGGYSKVQETFARISGYCEQTDIHSSNVTVKESVIYSAWLRLSPEIDTETRLEFVEEVLQRIELDSIQDSLVGKPGISGLSTEQRKRLTIAVELVANPSIMFMDEPTSGLDARAAAIVMRAVKNVVNTGRTVVCTIHQPSIDIFESFDELILMKRGGKIIYSGPLGKHSSKLIEYFEGIPGIPKIARKYNPATWMLDITSPSMEKKLGIDYAQLYRISTLYRELKELVKELSEPPAGSKDLQFLTRYPQRGFEQYNACLWKQHNSYWRSSTYNMVRILYMIIISVVFGAAFWQQGRKINNEQDMFNIIGSMFLPIVFFGLNNCTTIIPIVAAERAVMYREKYAGMYSSWAYSFAQVTIEIPYIFLQAFIFVVIIYPTVGYYRSLYKIIWCFYTIFCSLLCSTYLGMFLMSLSPSTEIANILTAASYTLLNLFSGYLLPRPRLPKWWVWLYWVCPTSWSLTGVITSQYGDVTQVISVYGEPKPINNMIRDYYGFQQDEKLLVGVMLIIFPITFACLFAYTTGRLNFQKR